MNFMKITKITSVNHISVFDDLIIKIHCYCHLNHYGEFLTIDKAWIGKFSVVNTETRFRGGGSLRHKHTLLAGFRKNYQGLALQSLAGTPQKLLVSQHLLQTRTR